MILKGIISLIVADATCQTLIGGMEDGAEVTIYKVFPVVAEQDTPKPYVLLRRTKGSAITVKGQVSDADSQFVNVVVFADEYKKCIDILEAVRAAIDNQRGTFESVKFDRILYQYTEDLFEKADDSFVITDTYLAIHLR